MCRAHLGRSALATAGDCRNLFVVLNLELQRLLIGAGQGFNHYAVVLPFAVLALLEHLLDVPQSVPGALLDYRSESGRSSRRTPQSRCLG